MNQNPYESPETLQSNSERAQNSKDAKLDSDFLELISKLLGTH